jgi:hypothetical protein
MRRSQTSLFLLARYSSQLQLGTKMASNDLKRSAADDAPELSPNTKKRSLANTHSHDEAAAVADNEAAGECESRHRIHFQ